METPNINGANAPQVVSTKETPKKEFTPKVDLNDPVDTIQIKKSESSTKKGAKIGAAIAGAYAGIRTIFSAKSIKNLFNESGAKLNTKGKAAIAVGLAAGAAVITGIGAGIGALSGKIFGKNKD